MRIGLAVLVVANFVITGAGLLLPFAAGGADSSAPWAGEVLRFNLAGWGLASLLMLSACVLGVFMHVRGRSGILAAASIASLVLPAATSAAYLWYLRDVAEGTIGGAVAFQLVLLSGGLAGVFRWGAITRQLRLLFRPELGCLRQPVDKRGSWPLQLLRAFLPPGSETRQFPVEVYPWKARCHLGEKWFIDFGMRGLIIPVL